MTISHNHFYYGHALLSKIAGSSLRQTDARSG
jgi:hypothetical protein